MGLFEKTTVKIDKPITLILFVRIYATKAFIKLDLHITLYSHLSEKSYAFVVLYLLIYMAFSLFLKSYVFKVGWE